MRDLSQSLSQPRRILLHFLFTVQLRRGVTEQLSGHLAPICVLADCKPFPSLPGGKHQHRYTHFPVFHVKEAACHVSRNCLRKLFYSRKAGRNKWEKTVMWFIVTSHSYNLNLQDATYKKSPILVSAFIPQQQDSSAWTARGLHPAYPLSGAN